MEKHTQDTLGNDDAWDEALGYVIEQHDNPTDPILADRLAAWLDKSPTHQAAYQQALSIWELTRQVAPEFEDNDRSMASLQAVAPAAVESQPESNPDPETEQPAPLVEAGHARLVCGRRLSSRVWAPVAIAACLIVLLLPPWSVSQWLSPRGMTTGIGEQQQVTLSDGSTTVLSTQTAIESHFTDVARQVSLHSGEAFFHVTKDPKRPFTVSSSLADITVVGTRFNVNAGHDQALIVTVEEGIVEVEHHADNRRYRLLAGDCLTLENGKSTLSTVAIDQVATWRNHEIIVNNWMVGDLIRELDRYQPGMTTLLGDSLSEQRISGVFHLDKPLAAMSAAVAPLGGKVRTIGPFTLISL